MPERGKDHVRAINAFGKRHAKPLYAWVAGMHRLWPMTTTSSLSTIAKTDTVGREALLALYDQGSLGGAAFDLYTGRIDGGMTMIKDPIVEEVREARLKHTKRFNSDLSAIVADLKDRQNKLERPVVKLSPKRVMRKAS